LWVVKKVAWTVVKLADVLVANMIVYWVEQTAATLAPSMVFFVAAWWVVTKAACKVETMVSSTAGMKAEMMDTKLVEYWVAKVAKKVA
jgi:hypothetical protein